ncbi:DUF1622 domain-containing protein [Geminicoccus flavidas]|uniref:DUF1622 domain-containing protein n=1 Tax=Geminicoccus flavidas TaxID=2506407 RepID=UPI00190FB3EB|nr:DUF1622 domain-containing protein [Geminicoccus flavidas]
MSIFLLPPPVWAQDIATAGSQGLLPRVPDWLEIWLHGAARGIEFVGVAVIVLGAVAATLHYLWRLLRSGSSTVVYDAFRASLGRAILLGLEFLVAADIIGTVAVDPTLENLGVLAVIVLIRTFLSFSLEVEIQGRWPWQQVPGQKAGPKPPERNA